MFNDITALGYGLVIFAVVIGVGSVVLYNFGGAIGCTYGYAFNTSAADCQQILSGGTLNSSNTTALSGVAYTNTNYLLGQLGSSGLAGWTPAIIALSIGMLFLGAFLLKGGNKGSYRR